ncbi:hypothetical protein PS2_025293 [Malus domestica]
MLEEILPYVHQKAIEMCPVSSDPETAGTIFSKSFLELYAGGHVQLPAFEWLHVDCFPALIQLACLLPPKEDNLRSQITKFLLAVSELYGDSYLTHTMLPVFLLAVGEEAELTFFPSATHSGIKGLRPRTTVVKRLATMCVLPLLLAGVLGGPSKHEQLFEYLRKLLVEGVANQSTKCSAEIVDAVRFLCTLEDHHSMIFL